MLGDEMGLSEGGAMAYGAGRRDVCGEGVWVGAYGAVGLISSSALWVVSWAVGCSSY